MLRLNPVAEPYWLDLAPGVRVLVDPCSSAIMVAARSSAEVEAVALDGSEHEQALVFAKAIARIAIRAWEGVGDIDGNPVEPSPALIVALLDLYPIFERFQVDYVGRGLMLEAEKNALSPAPSGTSAGARPIAVPAGDPAPTAPTA